MVEHWSDSVLIKLGGRSGIKMRPAQDHTGPNTCENKKKRNQQMANKSMEKIASGPIIAGRDNSLIDARYGIAAAQVWQAGTQRIDEK